MAEFTDKVVIVTGGGSGIGAAIAERFAAEGATLIIAGRDRERLERQGERMSGAPRILPTDVSKPADIAALIDFAIAECGRIDMMVNNAGTGMLGRIETADPARWHQVIATDLDSVFHAARLAVPHLKATKGVILNISSVCGTAGDYGFTAYNAAKAGVINLTRSLAIELAESGIRVNCISPGLIDTPANDSIPPTIKKAWVESIPMRRIGEPREIAEVALFLASSRSSFMTGQNLVVDGGSTAHTGQPNMLAGLGI